jgi:hypothetical protein
MFHVSLSPSIFYFNKENYFAKVQIIVMRSLGVTTFKNCMADN